MNFDDTDVFTQLEAADADALDGAEFGVVAMTPEGVVELYNKYESALSGLSRERVVGNHFFSAVAPCTNNYLVAQRFESEADLDVVIDYVFTLKMRPTKVKLRMLKRPTGRRSYLLVSRV
jgi:photoactive yellow protein